MPSVPSCPNQRDSITLTEVPSSSTAASFPLTIITNYKQNSNSNYRPITSLIDLTWDSYLVVSPMSAETILALDPMLNATIHITAYRLATTVHEQTAQYAQKVTKAKQKIEQLKQINQLTRLTTL